MKKVIALAVVIISVLIFATYCQPKIIGFWIIMLLLL